MCPAQTTSPDTVMLVSQGQMTAVLLLLSSSTSCLSVLPCLFFSFPFLPFFFAASLRGLRFFFLDSFFFISFFFFEGFFLFFCWLFVAAGSSLGLLLDLRPQTALIMIRCVFTRANLNTKARHKPKTSSTLTRSSFDEKRSVTSGTSTLSISGVYEFV